MKDGTDTTMSSSGRTMSGSLQSGSTLIGKTSQNMIRILEEREFMAMLSTTAVDLLEVELKRRLKLLKKKAKHHKKSPSLHQDKARSRRSFGTSMR